jgi:hypothetical protein
MTMGIFSRKPKIAFAPNELPMAEQSTQRRPSIFPNLLGFTDGTIGTAEGGLHGQQQTTFLGTKMAPAIVPAFSRKASLAVAELDKNPQHLRLGETDAAGIGNGDSMSRAFFETKLTLDEASTEGESLLGEKSVRMVLDKGKRKAPAQPNTFLGWETPPPKGLGKAHRRSKHKRPRSKRAQRRLDTDLDTFNAFAQNGQTPLTQSRDTSLRSFGFEGTNPSVTSFQSYVKPTIEAPSVYMYDPSTVTDRQRQNAVPVGDGFDALDVMADHIFRIGAQRKKWFKAPRLGADRLDIATGVSIRAKTGLYRTFPVNYDALTDFEVAVTMLNPEVAIKIDSQISRNVMRTYM